MGVALPGESRPASGVHLRHRPATDHSRRRNNAVVDFHHLRAFLAVAEELHFGRAAERLHIAQPPLSRTIQQLERHFGTPLFERTTRSVRLTTQGEALVGPAREIIDAFRMAERAVRAAGQGEVGRVRLGFAGPSSHMLIGRLARLVRQEQPGIELALDSVTYGNEALSRVIDGSLDMALVRMKTAPPGVDSRIVRLDHYVIVVPEGHPVAGRETVSLEELRDEPWIALPTASGSTLREDFLRKAHEAGFVPNIVQQAPDSWTIMALVAAGVGLTMTVDTGVAHIPKTGISVVPLDHGAEAVAARLAWRAQDPSPALHRVIELSTTALPTPEGAPAS